MKVSVETASKIVGYTTLSPIDNRDEYIDDPYSKDINIKIDGYGLIAINGEIMVMLKSLVNHDHTVYCNFKDSKLNEEGEFVPAPLSGGISVSIGNMELFDLWVEEYSDKDMWTRFSFKELFKDLINDHTNRQLKSIWRKDIEKARKFIIDSFDEAVAELNE